MVALLVPHVSAKIMPFIAGGYGDFPRCDLGGRRRFMAHGTDSEITYSLLVRRSCTSARGNYRTYVGRRYCTFSRVK